MTIDLERAERMLVVIEAELATERSVCDWLRYHADEHDRAAIILAERLEVTKAAIENERARFDAEVNSNRAGQAP